MFAVLNALVASTLLASTVLGHFTLDYPASRGFDEDIESQFCGGFSSVGPRRPFPLGKAPIQITSGHPEATVGAFLSTKANPADNKDFNATGDGQLTNFFKLDKTGAACWNVDLGSLGIGLTNGSEVTILVQFNGGDGLLYQCTDLVLDADYQVPSNETCSVDAAVAGGNSSSTNSSTSQAASSTPSQPAASPSSSPSSSASQLAVGGASALLALAAAVAVM